MVAEILEDQKYDQKLCIRIHLPYIIKMPTMHYAKHMNFTYCHSLKKKLCHTHIPNQKMAGAESRIGK